MKVVIVNQPSEESEKKVFQKLHQFLSTADVGEKKTTPSKGA